jgi:hypothetical protein
MYQIGSINADTVILRDGKFEQSAATDTIYCSTFIDSTTDSTILLAPVIVTGNVTLASGVKFRAGAGKIVCVAGAARPTLAINGATAPICTLGNGAIINGGGTFAELRLNRSGSDTVVFEKQKKVTITTIDSLDWSGPDTSHRNRVASSVNDTLSTSRDTIRFMSGTVGFAYMWFRNNVFIDTVRCRTGCKSEGGNY